MLPPYSRRCYIQIFDKTISGVFLICFVFRFAHKMSVRHFIFSTQSFQLGNRCFALSSLLQKVATEWSIIPDGDKNGSDDGIRSYQFAYFTWHLFHLVCCVRAPARSPNIAIEMREMYAIRFLSLRITQTIELKMKRIACHIHIHIENLSQYTKQLINYANEFLWPSASCLVHTGNIFNLHVINRK